MIPASRRRNGAVVRRVALEVTSRSFPRGRVLILLESVSRVFGDGAARSTALRDVSLSVARGEFVAVIGPSGSGKTTLLNLVGGLDVPASGRIVVDGEDLSRLPPDRLSDFRLERVGFVFQQFSLIPVLTAAENVEFPLLFRKGLSAADRRRAVGAALGGVGLAGKEHRRPGEMSGGEQQRVAVARALAGGPALVLADEPTANLDHDNGRAVVSLLNELRSKSGTTLLLATHDPEIVLTADRVIALHDGRTVEGRA